MKWPRDDVEMFFCKKLQYEMEKLIKEFESRDMIQVLEIKLSDRRELNILNGLDQPNVEITFKRYW